MRKKTILAKSQIPQNQEIAKNAQWTPEVIEERLKRLTSSMIQVF